MYTNDNEPPVKPTCFGTRPVPPSALYEERKCYDCPVAGECQQATWHGQIADETIIIATQPSPAAAINESVVNARRDGMFERALGLKKDDGKVRWSLLPKGVITTILQVLEFGATKYAVDNWRHVEDHERRYYDAAMRHIEAWRMKETNDPESGLPHLAHAACCLLFLMWFDARKED